MEPIRVLIIDDQQLFAEALAVWLARQPGFEVVGAVHTVAAAQSLLAAAHVDVQLVDLDLGGESGIALLDHARDRYPLLRSVILSASRSPEAVATAVRHGAVSWLSKTAAGDTLLQVLRGVLRDEAWIPPDLLAGLLHTLAEPASSPVLDRLTGRERQVLQCLVDGLTRAQIAETLIMSPNTVRTHTQNLLAKLPAHSALEAVSVALRCGMRPDEHAVGQPSAE
ncbi:response regulator [Actinocatenispora sera]|uniref:response regulator n=1 Tax=Actinocatenispora sera TaxID=390989 RepID=UPI0004C2BBE4|nr:response regulator transcription factor [Actinocatenispora sera]